MKDIIEKLEQAIGYQFNDKSLPVQALTHTSYLNETDLPTGDYQRLEFLGDAVLGLLLAELLYDCHPNGSEGELSQLRSRLAGQDMLAEMARKLGLNGLILLGRGERLTAGNEKDSLLADVFESVIAAVYRDSGLSSASILVKEIFEELVCSPDLIVHGRDAKSELQELLSRKNYDAPQYVFTDEAGPPHDRIFSFKIISGHQMLGSGQGKTKKSAQQAAASAALELLKGHSGGCD